MVQREQGAKRQIGGGGMVRHVHCDQSANAEGAQGGRWGPSDLSGGAPCCHWKLADPAVSRSTVPVMVTWVRVDDEMPQHAVLSGPNLFINNLNKTDNGTYRCEASNIVGKAHSDYMLYVYDTTATTEPAVHDSRAGEEGSIRAVDHAVIGGVVAVVVFAMLCLLIILGRYFARHKGTYFTHEAKGADDAADADTAIINAEGGQNNSEEKKEYFI
uniref:Cell adhesion molecule 1 n=1 Tax=Rousettus aegyptiacus TaxID=9407 RepID=A0A7J8GX77_ROUAE|nr:cell adhesion molecule 1 [Rousettus aegyptiacus]